MQLRRLIPGAIGLLLFAGLALAADYKGKVVKVTDDKITIQIDKKDVEIAVTKDTMYVNSAGNALAAGLKNVRPGADVKIITNFKVGKEAAEKVEVILTKPAG